VVEQCQIIKRITIKNAIIYIKDMLEHNTIYKSVAIQQKEDLCSYSLRIFDKSCRNSLLLNKNFYGI
jgi:hypothetical protein